MIYSYVSAYAGNQFETSFQKKGSKYNHIYAPNKTYISCYSKNKCLEQECHQLLVQSQSSVLTFFLALTESEV